MTTEEKEIATYCLKASSGYHSEVCEECVKYPICDHTMQDDVVETIIKALEQQPCENCNCISRQAVLNTLDKMDKALDTDRTVESYKKLLTECYKDLPPVTPKEKTGHWILKRTFPTKLYDEYLNEYKCSECYRGIRCTESQLVNYPYCHCGAKMVEPQESEADREVEG